MKRIVFLILLVSLAAVVVMGHEDTDIAYHIRTQTVTRTMMQYLGLPDSDVEDVLALQYRYRLQEARGNEEIEALKARVAAELGSENANSRKMARWLRKINDIEADQSIARVYTYQKTRRILGEERWNEIVRNTNAQGPLNTEAGTPTQDRERIHDGTSTGDSTPTATRTTEQSRSSGSSSGSSGESGNNNGSGSGSGKN